jgi:hypothetical protein
MRAPYGTKVLTHPAKLLVRTAPLAPRAAELVGPQPGQELAEHSWTGAIWVANIVPSMIALNSPSSMLFLGVAGLGKNRSTPCESFR